MRSKHFSTRKERKAKQEKKNCDGKKAKCEHKNDSI